MICYQILIGHIYWTYQAIGQQPLRILCISILGSIYAQHVVLIDV